MGEKNEQPLLFRFRSLGVLTVTTHACQPFASLLMAIKNYAVKRTSDPSP